MALLYVDEHNASLNRGTVTTGETLSEGEFIVDNEDGTHRRFDPANDALPHGIIVHHAGGDAIQEHDEDYVAYDDLWQYEAGENFYYQPLTSVDQIHPRTLSDNGTDPAPSLGDGTVLGVVTINGETEVVESGYTDNGGTEYSEGGTGDFVAIGRQDKHPQDLRIESAYDQRVPIRLDADLFTTSG
jgi:hypothetical protein